VRPSLPIAARAHRSLALPPLVLALAVMGAACGGGESESQTAEPAAPAAVTASPVDPATAGAVSGTVTFEGTPPARQTVSTATDPSCTVPVTTETVVTGGGGTLQNVFVYVKDGLGDLVFPIPMEPVVLGQDGCMYRPHVLGIQVGQTLEILNGDDTLHNIHAVPAQNAEFNKAQPLKGARTTHVFSTAEVLVPFKCDVHKWMSAHVGVVSHPFFAVTDSDGAFELKGLPPGTYTIEAVHETLGRRTQTVTLAAQGTETLAFTFSM
jgi:plastocyanin